MKYRARTLEGSRRLLLIEAKATRTPMPGDARNLARLAVALGPGAAARAVVVHDDTKEYAAPMAPMPGRPGGGLARVAPLARRAAALAGAGAVSGTEAG
jgi:hypothetical protein